MANPLIGQILGSVLGRSMGGSAPGAGVGGMGSGAGGMPGGLGSILGGLTGAQQLLGRDELANLSSQLGVGQHEVAEGFSEILPEVLDRLSPDGHVPADADSTLDAGQSALQRMLGGMR